MQASKHFYLSEINVKVGGHFVTIASLSLCGLQVNTKMLRTLRQSRGVAEDKLTANTLSPDESASRIIKVIEGLNESNSGSFWAADTGKVIGW